MSDPATPDAGLVVEVRRVAKPHKRGRMFGMAVLARLESEPPEAATVLVWCVGRPRKDVERTCSTWLEGNRGKLADRLARRREREANNPARVGVGPGLDDVGHLQG